MKKYFSLLLVVMAIAGVASAETQAPIYCVQSTARHIVIKPSESLVEVNRWGALEDVEQIVGTSVRYLETSPAKWQTTYDLGGGYEVTVIFPSGSTHGTGYLSINGQKTTEYTCSK